LAVFEKLRLRACFVFNFLEYSVENLVRYFFNRVFGECMNHKCVEPFLSRMLCSTGYSERDKNRQWEPEFYEWIKIQNAKVATCYISLKNEGWVIFYFKRTNYQSLPILTSDNSVNDHYQHLREANVFIAYKQSLLLLKWNTRGRKFNVLKFTVNFVSALREGFSHFRRQNKIEREQEINKAKIKPGSSQASFRQEFPTV